LNLIQINGAQNRSIYEHNNPLGISYALHMLLKQGPLSQSSTIYCENLHSLTVKKIVIWYKCLLLPDKVLSEIFGTIFNRQFFKVLKLV